jgi:hypothetical protein
VESGTKVDLDFVARGIAIFNPYQPKCTLQIYPTFQSLPSLFQVYPRHQSFYLGSIYQMPEFFLNGPPSFFFFSYVFCRSTIRFSDAREGTE